MDKSYSRYTRDNRVDLYNMPVGQIHIRDFQAAFRSLELQLTPLETFVEAEKRARKNEKILVKQTQSHCYLQAKSPIERKGKERAHSSEEALKNSRNRSLQNTVSGDEAQLFMGYVRQGNVSRRAGEQLEGEDTPAADEPRDSSTISSSEAKAPSQHVVIPTSDTPSAVTTASAIVPAIAIESVYQRDTVMHAPSYTPWTWSEEHRDHYCYLIFSSGRAYHLNDERQVVLTKSTGQNTIHWAGRDPKHLQPERKYRDERKDSGHTSERVDSVNATPRGSHQYAQKGPGSDISYYLPEMEPQQYPYNAYLLCDVRNSRYSLCVITLVIISTKARFSACGLPFATANSGPPETECVYSDN
jgi:hypothetical protein